MISPDATPEEAAQAMRVAEEYWQGRKQGIVGETRKEIAEVFFKILHSSQRERLEKEIARLQSVEDKERFRAQLATLLFEAWYGGYLSSAETSKTKKG